MDDEHPVVSSNLSVPIGHKGPFFAGVDCDNPKNLCSAPNTIASSSKPSD